MGLVEPPELLRRHRLTVDDYYRMGEAGVLAPDARVELIDGEVLDMAPIGTRHASVVMRLTRRFGSAAGESATLSVQRLLRLDQHSEPQPDVMLLRPRPDFYATAHPTANDVLLLVEVSQSSVRYDREIELPLYAERGVAEVWIVDLDRNVLRIYRKPVAGQYTDNVETAAPGARAPAALPAAVIELDDLLAAR